MNDPVTDAQRDRRARTARTRERTVPEERRVEPVELARWVEERSRWLGERWLGEIVARTGGSPEVEELLGEFVELLLEIVPACLGPYRQQVEPFWQQTSELYGQVGAMRGLAAGEVIEEFQHLREGLIRLLYADPPANGGARLSLRDLLRLNRLIDRGVSQANVGHTDALFFALFQGSGAPQHLTEELRGEVSDQLQATREELRSIMSLLER